MVKAKLSELEDQGLIKAFEYTYELAWTTLKDFLEYSGQIDRAFQLELLSDGDLWMDMLKSRNRTSHTYNEETAREICQAVKKEYYPAFAELVETLNRLKSRSDS